MKEPFIKEKDFFINTEYIYITTRNLWNRCFKK